MTARPRRIVFGRGALCASLAVLVAACGVFLPVSAEAATILAEPFAYNTGDLNTQGGWSGSTNWDVESGNLSYPASSTLTASGNRATINGGGSSVIRSIGSTLDFDAANSYYVSFLIRKDAIPATGSEYFWMTLRDGSSSKVAMGIGSGENVLLGEGTGGGAFSVSSNKILGSTDYLYVAKILTAGSGNEQYFAKVYGPSDIVPMTEPGTWDVTRTASVTGAASLLRFEAGSVGYYTVDEILMGTTWADVVVPEPSTLAMLLGLGGIGLLGYLRRRPRR